MIVSQRTRPEELARQRLFIASPHLWPAWPFLPLIRRREDREELGVLFDARGVADLCGYRTTVIRTNLFDLPETLAALLALPREVFDSGDELIAAGWRVD